MKFELPPPIPSRQKAQEPPKKEDHPQPVEVVRSVSSPPSLIVPPPLPPQKCPSEQSEQRTLQPSLLREFEAGIGPPVSPAPQSPQKIQRSENEKAGKTAEAVQRPSPPAEVVAAHAHQRPANPPPSSQTMSARRRWAVIAIFILVPTVTGVLIYKAMPPTPTPAFDPAAYLKEKGITDAPPRWQDVESDPDFAAATPEDRLVAFDRWHTAAYNYASTLPDWAQHKDEFNQQAADVQNGLSKAAGGITPDQARVKVAIDAIAAEQAEVGAAALTEDQIEEILRSIGEDVYTAYHQSRGQPEKSAANPAPTPSATVDERLALLDDLSKNAATAEPSAPTPESSASAYASSTPRYYPPPIPSSIPKAIAIQTPAPVTYRVAGIAEGDYLNVRQGPGSNYRTVAKLRPGTSGIIRGTGSALNGAIIWQEISVNGISGWVNADYLSLTRLP